MIISLVAIAVSPFSDAIISDAMPSHCDAIMPDCIARFSNSKNLFAISPPHRPARISPLPALASTGQPRVWKTIFLPSHTRVADDFNAIVQLYFWQVCINELSEASGASLKISPS